jgi:hypothetical protein
MKLLRNWNWRRAPDALVTEKQEGCLWTCLLFVNLDKYTETWGALYFLKNISAYTLVLGFAVTIETHTAPANARLSTSFTIWRYAYRLVPAVKTKYLNNVYLGKSIYVNRHQAKRWQSTWLTDLPGVLKI